MIIDNIKVLLNWIVIVSVLLAICVSVDYASSDVTVSNLNESAKVNLTTTDVINGTHYVVMDKDQGIAKIQNDGKIIISKPKYPVISIWAKPSVRSSYAYKWYYRTWVNYCPNCHRYNSLLKNPKGVPEKELTCKYCDSDFCGVTGKEKYSWSRKYLRSA